MLVGPLLLLLYEPAVGNVRWRDAGAFFLRISVLGTVASLWWIVPLMVHARYGVDFLQFTEQPGTIWATGNAAEALRLMGYWTSYVGVGFHGFNAPMFTESGTLLFNPLVVGASLLLPALAVAGFIWTRRAPYAPFLLLVLLAGAAIEVAGFPDGTPARSAMVWLYRNVPIVAFMRTDAEGAPLVALGVAGLLGLAAAAARSRLRHADARTPGRVGLIAAPAALATLIVFAALPLDQGRRGRATAHLEADSGGVDEHRRGAHPRAASQHARDGPAEPDLRLLRLGRDGRPDPPPPDAAPGRGPLRDPVLRPAVLRPAGDRRQARSAGPSSTRGAAAAPAAARRGRSGHRHG
jgi:hypothetical protein